MSGTPATSKMEFFESLVNGFFCERTVSTDFLGKNMLKLSIDSKAANSNHKEPHRRCCGGPTNPSGKYIFRLNPFIRVDNPFIPLSFPKVEYLFTMLCCNIASYRHKFNSVCLMFVKV